MSKSKKSRKQKFLHGVTIAICIITSITLFAGFAVNMF